MCIFIKYIQKLKKNYRFLYFFDVIECINIVMKEKSKILNMESILTLYILFN